jgi:hypothetical protein
MDFLEYVTSFGQGYTSVDLGSSSSPPAELTNPEILSSLDFQKPVNGTPVVQSLNTFPPTRNVCEREEIGLPSKSDIAVQSSGLSLLLRQSTTDATILESDTVNTPMRNMRTISTLAIETVRRKPPLMIQRVGRLSLQGYSIDGNNISSSQSKRSSFAFDSSDKILIETILTNPAASCAPSIITLPKIVIDGLERDEAGVQTIIRLNPSSLTTCPQVVLDAPKGSPHIETTTPVEIESFSDNESEAVAVTAEVVPGSEEFILESTIAIFIEEEPEEEQAEKEESAEETNVVDEPPVNDHTEVIRDYSESDQVAEFVEAQLLSESAGTTVTPSEVEQETLPHTKPTAFATFAAITALVKMQRRIKRRYEQQRTDLINSLGL